MNFYLGNGSVAINKHMKPYTYLIKHKPTGRVYYGYRGANKVEPELDLWHIYFTSSFTVKDLIEETSKDDFEVQIRQTFESVEQAAKWEKKVLKRCDVIHNDKWLNQTAGGYSLPTPQSRAKISAFHKGRPKSEEHKRKISEAHKGSKKPWSASNFPDNSGKNHPLWGKKHSEETKKKMRISQSKPRGPRGPNKDKVWTEEEIKRFSDTAKAHWAANPRKPYSKRNCPHCGKDYPINIYPRWHGDNCKQR